MRHVRSSVANGDKAADAKPAVNARDRIGNGPWQNFKGEIVAQSVDDLHSDNNKLGANTSLTSGAGSFLAWALHRTVTTS
jgi:hypothetical protein